MEDNCNDQEPTSSGIELKMSKPLSTIDCNQENDWQGSDQHEMHECVQVNNAVDGSKVDCVRPFKFDKVATTTVDYFPTSGQYKISYPKIKAISTQRQMQLSNSENNSAHRRAIKQLVAKRHAESKKVAQRSNKQISKELERDDSKVMSSNNTLPLSPKITKRVNTLEEINMLRISRYKLELFMYLPIFEETVVKCFVRVCIGSHKSIAVYRIAEIIGVVELPKAYKLRTMSSKIGLRLKHGRQEISLPIKYVSNQSFTKSEFRWWQKSCAAECVRMPNLKYIGRKLNNIKKALHYKRTKNDIECTATKIESPVKQPSKIPLENTCLINNHSGAIKLCNFSAVDMLNKKFSKITELNANLYSYRVSYLSGRNHMPTMGKSKNIEYKFNLKANVVYDPFTRRRTQPRLAVGKRYKENENEVPHTTKLSWSPTRKKSATSKDLNGNGISESL